MRKQTIACAWVLGVVACGSEPLQPKDVPDETDDHEQPTAEAPPRDEEPAMPQRRARIEAPERVALPIGCGDLVFPEVAYPADVVAWDGAIVVAGSNGVWRFDEDGATLLDPRWAWRLRPDGDGLAFLTAEPSIQRVDLAGNVEDVLQAGTHVTDFALRGEEIWMTEELFGRVVATHRTTGERRVLAAGSDADWMLVEPDAVYVSMPPVITQIDDAGEASVFFDAPESTQVFYAVSRLAGDPTHLYFTTYIDGGLARVERATGQYQVLEHSRDHAVTDVALHGGRVYWAERDFDDGRSRVRRAALDGEGAAVFLDETCVTEASQLLVIGDVLYVLQPAGAIRVPLSP